MTSELSHDELARLAAYSPTAEYYFDRGLRRPLRLDRRGERAANQLVEQLGRSGAERWLRSVAAELRLDQ